MIMNPKEEILRILKLELKGCDMRCDLNEYEYVTQLITAVESAIFDVPSEEEIDEAYNNIEPFLDRELFKDGCNFILHYKKPNNLNLKYYE